MMHLDAEVKRLNEIVMVLPFGAYDLAKKGMEQVDV